MGGKRGNGETGKTDAGSGRRGGGIRLVKNSVGPRARHGRERRSGCAPTRACIPRKWAISREKWMDFDWQLQVLGWAGVGSVRKFADVESGKRGRKHRLSRLLRFGIWGTKGRGKSEARNSKLESNSKAEIRSDGARKGDSEVGSQNSKWTGRGSDEATERRSDGGIREGKRLRRATSRRGRAQSESRRR